MAAFIKFDDLEGEARDKGHRNWSEILSFDQAIHNNVDAEPKSGRRR